MSPEESAVPRESKVPLPTLERLATYYRYLSDIEIRNVETISSSAIEAATGIRATQFRKDLSYFGEFGRPGIGYDVRELKQRIARILKVESEQPVILIGAGNLGSALVGFFGLPQHNFHIVAAFDNNPRKIGQPLWDLKVMDIANLKAMNDSLRAQIGIISVPAIAAQACTDVLVDAGIKVILNFAPTTIKVPDGVFVRNVCFLQELAVLSYYLTP
jgi:redox-sensing transcriptional repressor